MITVVCITILLLHFLVIPFAFSIEGHIDLFSNDGFIKVKLYGFIRLFYKQAFVKKVDAMHGDLVLKGGKKEKYYHINANKNDDKSIAKFFKIRFIPSVKISYLQARVAVGKSDDAFFTTMTVGGIKIVLLSLFSVVKSSHDVEICDEILPEYNKDAFSIMFFGIITVTLADIIYSYFLYLFRKRRKV